MAKTIRTGYHLINAGVAATLHTAAGRLLAVLISHANAATQTVTFYDASAATPGTEILVLMVNPAQSPFYLELPRDAGITFDTALHVVQGNSNVSVWSVDYG